MKGKVLKAYIEELDPTGETEWCIENADINEPTGEPAYYDGSLHVITRDAEGYPISGKRVRKGSKIVLHPMYVHDFISYPNFTVEYETDEDRQRYEIFDKRTEHENDMLEARVDKKLFADWVFLRIQSGKPIPLGWVSRIKEAAEKFYDENLSPDDPFVKSSMGKSQAEWMQDWWDDNIHAEWNNYGQIIIKKKVPKIGENVENT